MNIKETVETIDNHFKQLTKDVEKRIIDGRFEFEHDNGYGTSAPITISDITLNIKTDGVIFEIWNANDVEHTSLYSIKSDSFERVTIDKSSGKFSNPKKVRQALRKFFNDKER